MAAEVTVMRRPAVLQPLVYLNNRIVLLHRSSRRISRLSSRHERRGVRWYGFAAGHLGSGGPERAMLCKSDTSLTPL